MSTEKAVRTEDVFRTLAENCPDIIDRFNRKCQHMYVNAAGLRQLSLPAEKVIGKTVRETGVPEPFCTLWKERVLRVIKTAKPLEVSDVFPGPYGLTYFNSLCVPEFDKTGGVQSVLVISRDITERKKVEDQLRRSESELAEAQRLARIGSWNRDLATNRIVWSHALFDLYDIDEQASPISFDAVLERVHPDDRKKLLRATEKAVAHGTNFKSEYRIVTRRGELRYIRALGYARKNAQGAAVELFGTTQDISESKRAEESLRRLNEELENRVRQRTAKLRELALELTRAEQKERKRISDVLHENIQQQLVALRFKVEHIQAREGRSQTAADLEWVLENLRSTSDQIRNLSAKLRPPVLYDFGLKAAIKWLADDMKTKFDFDVRVDGEALPKIRSDEINEFAFAAVSELLLNAVKHSGSRCAQVVLSTPKRRALTVTVSDSGAGLAPANASGINTLGLFRIRERAEMLRGCFEVTGSPGKGTRATLTIPIR